MGRRLTMALAGFSALSAFAGAGEMLVLRDGHRVLPRSLLDGTPFTSFLVPALLLGVVIGGTSLLAMIATARRARGAGEATMIAGGALVVWIAVEGAAMRQFSPLQVLFGGLGVALAALGARQAWRAGGGRARWLITVTGAEAAGYLAPAITGLLLTRAGVADGALVLGLVGAGMLEGLALGWGQARALPLPVARWRWAALTAAGAGLVWAAVMGVVVLAARPGVPAPAALAAGALAGAAALVAIGGAQWLELRRHAPRAWAWIAWTALAWTLALPLSFAVGPFVDEATPLAAHLVLWGAGGLVMAFVMAAVTWQGVRRLPGSAPAT